jgi:hypothetical protein
MRGALDTRFWAKVQRTKSGCWLWTTARHPTRCKGVPVAQLRAELRDRLENA